MNPNSLGPGGLLFDSLKAEAPHGHRRPAATAYHLGVRKGIWGGIRLRVESLG